MEFFASTFYGFFFGFALGVGCSLVVLYAIYSGGYRKALEDSLRDPHSERYDRMLQQATKRVSAESAIASGPNRGDQAGDRFGQ